MELKIDVTISDDLSLSIGYNTFKSKVHIVVSMKPLNMSVCLSVCRATFLKEKWINFWVLRDDQIPKGQSKPIQMN